MVLHFALLDFITSCVKVITFRVVITSCVNGITSRGDYYILRQYYILRRNSRAVAPRVLYMYTYRVASTHDLKAILFPPSSEHTVRCIDCLGDFKAVGSL